MTTGERLGDATGPSGVERAAHFLGAVVDNRPVPADQASFEDGYRAAVVCDAILASAQEEKRLDIA